MGGERTQLQLTKQHYHIFTSSEHRTMTNNQSEIHELWECFDDYVSVELCEKNGAASLKIEIELLRKK